MKGIFRSLAAVSVAVALSGCGEDQTVVSSIQGKAIDDYIQGATVFLDLNGNAARDPGEPAAVTGEAGAFSLGLTAAQEACASYSPLFAEVPVGAVDSGFGEITEPYVMALPPSTGVDGQYYITPLTSMIWNSILGERGEELGWSCDELRADPAKWAQVSTLISDTLDDLVEHYNLSAATLFSDFIEHQDSAAHARAIAIVAALKRSMTATLALREAEPDADWAQVRIFQGSRLDANNAYPDAWYRHTLVFKGDHAYGSLVKLTDDLSDEQRSIMVWSNQSGRNSDFWWQQGYVFESRNGDDSPYRCESSERLGTRQGHMEYEVTNFIDTSAWQPSAPEDCAFTDVNNINQRYLFIEEDASQERVGNGREVIQYTYRGTEYVFDDLPDRYSNFPENAGTLDKEEFLAYLEQLTWRFDETPEIQTGRTYVQSRIWYEGTTRYRRWELSSGTVWLDIEYADGTHQRLCQAPYETELSPCN